MIGNGYIQNLNSTDCHTEVVKVNIGNARVGSM